ncbi:MAG: hypothetical protein ABSG25_04470, partial [Bryobacteraceae bacterium]
MPRIAARLALPGGFAKNKLWPFCFKHVTLQNMATKKKAAKPAAKKSVVKAAKKPAAKPAAKKG